MDILWFLGIECSVGLLKVWIVKGSDSVPLPKMSKSSMWRDGFFKFIQSNCGDKAVGKLYAYIL